MANQEQWTSKIGFILAAAGSAIGLGAIWKFPYMAGYIIGPRVAGQRSIAKRQ